MISHHDSELLESTVPWRRSRLRRAGFDGRLAAELAARILAPLEPEER
jgi:hypothetical protein